MIPEEISAAEKEYLYIQTSQIPNAGQGLFTAIDIYKNEIIARFEGEILNKNEAGRRADLLQDQYFINLTNGKIMDSAPVHCFAKYANDAEGAATTGFKNNAIIGLDLNEGVCLIAKRKIKAGEEIFCGYGAAYWKKHGQRMVLANQ